MSDTNAQPEGWTRFEQFNELIDFWWGQMPMVAWNVALAAWRHAQDDGKFYATLQTLGKQKMKNRAVLKGIAWLEEHGWMWTTDDPKKGRRGNIPIRMIFIPQRPSAHRECAVKPGFNCAPAGRLTAHQDPVNCAPGSTLTAHRECAQNRTKNRTNKNTPTEQHTKTAARAADAAGAAGAVGFENVGEEKEKPNTEDPFAPVHRWLTDNDVHEGKKYDQIIQLVSKFGDLSAEARCIVLDHIADGCHGKPGLLISRILKEFPRWVRQGVPHKRCRSKSDLAPDGTYRPIHIQERRRHKGTYEGLQLDGEPSPEVRPAREFGVETPAVHRAMTPEELERKKQEEEQKARQQEEYARAAKKKFAEQKAKQDAEKAAKRAAEEAERERIRKEREAEDLAKLQAWRDAIPKEQWELMEKTFAEKWPTPYAFAIKNASLIQDMHDAVRLKQLRIPEMEAVA